MMRQQRLVVSGWNQSIGLSFAPPPDIVFALLAASLLRALRFALLTWQRAGERLPQKRDAAEGSLPVLRQEVLPSAAEDAQHLLARPVYRPQALRADPTRSDLIRSDPIRSDPIRSGPIRPDPI